MTPSPNLTIGWNEIDKREYTDGLGRAFTWTNLKNKKIYMCGHGAHIYRDGYTTVPAGTTVNFYQVYGQGMYASRLLRFINGSEAWQPERTFEAGKSCPNMTLFDDDNHEIGPTYQAVSLRLNNAPDKNDYYVFMCNGFRGLQQYSPVVKEGMPQHSFAGKKFLKLSEILLHLEGNTIEWTCCQDLTMERNDYLIDGNAVTWGKYAEAMNSAKKQGATAVDNARLNLFSDIVRAGLKASLDVKAEIERGYNVPSKTHIFEQHQEGSVVSTVHGNPKRVPQYYLNRNRAGTPQGDLDKIAKYRDQIQRALHALDADPQPKPPFERPWAARTLKRGLLTVESMLIAFGRS